MRGKRREIRSLSLSLCSFFSSDGLVGICLASINSPLAKWELMGGRREAQLISSHGFTAPLGAPKGRGTQRLKVPDILHFDDVQLGG